MELRDRGRERTRILLFSPHLWKAMPDSKASAYNAGDPSSIPGSGRSPGEGNSNPLQYSCLENPVDRGAWRATVHGTAKSRTRLSNFTFTFFLEGKLFHRARRPWTEQRQDLVGRTSVQKGLSLILLEHVSLSVAYL